MQLEWIFDELFVIMMFVATHRNSNLHMPYFSNILFDCTDLFRYMFDYSDTTLDRVCLVIIIYWSMLILFAHMLRHQKEKHNSIRLAYA